MFDRGIFLGWQRESRQQVSGTSEGKYQMGQICKFRRRKTWNKSQGRLSMDSKARSGKSGVSHSYARTTALSFGLLPNKLPLK